MSSCCSPFASRSSPSACRRYLQDVVILSFLWAGLALAWNIAGGYAGLISFGHAAFFGIGAYTSTHPDVPLRLTPWIGLWLGGPPGGGFAARVLTLVCARLRGPFFILSTLAAAEVVRIGALNWTALTGGAEGLAILPTPSLANMVFASKTVYAALMLGYLVIVLHRHQDARRLALRLLPVRGARRRGCRQRRRRQPAAGAHRRHGVERAS